jgi:hypothetical protein
LYGANDVTLEAVDGDMLCGTLVLEELVEPGQEVRPLCWLVYDTQANS